MSNWANDILEPDPGDKPEENIPPQDVQGNVGVLPEPEPTPPVVPPQPKVDKKPSWQDFSLEDHVRAWMGVLPLNRLYLKKVGANRYRANVYDPDGYSIVDSTFLEITHAPDGYVITDQVEIAK